MALKYHQLQKTGSIIVNSDTTLKLAINDDYYADNRNYLVVNFYTGGLASGVLVGSKIVLANIGDYQTAIQLKANVEYQYSGSGDYYIGIGQTATYINRFTETPFNYSLGPYDGKGGNFTGGYAYNVKLDKNSSFLNPELYAFSLIGITDDTTYNPNFGDSGVTNFVCGYTDDPPPSNPIFEPKEYNGILHFKLSNKGTDCLSTTGNNSLQIAEFAIQSFYTKDTQLNLQVSYHDNLKYYNKMVTYGIDVPFCVTGWKKIDLYGTLYRTYVTGMVSGGTVDKASTYFYNGFDGPFICSAKGKILFLTTGITNVISGAYPALGIVESYLEITGYYYSGYRLCNSGFDPYINVSQESYTLSENDSYLTSSYRTPILNNIYSLDLSGFSTGLKPQDAGDVYDVIHNDDLKINVLASPKFVSNYDKAYKVESRFKIIDEGTIRYTGYVSPQAAWASYNVASGMNSKNVSSYAIEFVNDLFSPNGELANVQTELEPEIYYVNDDVRNNYISYCIENKDCEENELNNVEICYTGEPAGTEYEQFLSGIINQFASKPRTSFDPPPSNRRILTGEISSLFNIWSGEIHYNNFRSGDKVAFSLYPFDYTGLFREYYSGTNPLYPSLEFNLTYPNDFNSIDSLVTALNTRLYNNSYYIWHVYPCLKNTLDKIYINSPVAFFEKVGSNTIKFYSLTNSSGHDLYLNLQPRTPNFLDRRKLKYLLPSYIRLEGRNSSSDPWQVLDVRSNIDWNNALITPYNSTGFGEKFIFTGNSGESVNLEVEQTGEYLTLLKLKQSGYSEFPIECGGYKYFERDITVKKPINFPLGTQFDTGSCQPIETGVTGQNNDITPTGNAIFTYVFRTGWNLDRNYIQSTYSVNPEDLQFNQYRIYISGISGANYNYEVLSKKFVVKNINLFGANKVPSIHYGDPLCLINANYEADIQGYVPVTLTGLLTGYIGPDQSGVYTLNNVAILAKIDGLNEGSWVKFNTESGRLTSSFGTAFITDSITGTGILVKKITGHFYNPGTTELKFVEDWTGYFNKTGFYSGSYYELTAQTVERESLEGGLLTQRFIHSGVTGSIVTGYLRETGFYGNLPARYYLTGVTGYNTNNGIWEHNQTIYYTPSVNTPVEYYYGEPENSIPAKTILNYNQPNNLDFIVINERSIIYYSGDSNYTSPDYFDSPATLIDIINSDTGFAVTASGLNSNQILLTSNLRGELGNNTQVLSYPNPNTSNPMSFSSDTLTGGLDFYQTIRATGGLFAGNLSFITYKTGYYEQNSSSGIISGYINSFQGVRTFTGVWNLSTGYSNDTYVDFLLNNLVTGNNTKYYNKMNNTLEFVDPSVVDIKINYINQFEDAIGDVARLTFSGEGTNSGISFLIQGV